MTAMTEDEIREYIDQTFPGFGFGGQLSDAFGQAFAAIEGLWTDDLRPSEQRALDTIMADRMQPVREAAIEQLRAAMIAAALEFTTKYPDAPVTDW